MTTNPLMLEFGHQSILIEEHIERFRNYISQKYTRAPQHQRAQILAHAIHSILDREINAPRLADFVDCLEIKIRILQKALKQPTFSITGSDLLEGLLTADIKSSNVAYREFVANWCASFVEKKQIRNLINLDVHALSNHWNFRVPSLAGELTITQDQPVVTQTHKDSTKAYTKSASLLKMGITVALAFGLACNLPIETPSLGTDTSPIKQDIYIGQTILDQLMAPQKTDQYFLYQPTGHYSNLYPSLNYTGLQIRPVSLWLLSKDSLLAQRDYLLILDNISQLYDVDPYLLLAIIGQEQGFVPSTHPSSELIILNPFNVFGSWQTYGPGFKVSCTIAAHTVAKALKNCPQQVDPFLWLNKTYAEDPNWYIGVEKIYHSLLKSVTPTP